MRPALKTPLLQPDIAAVITTKLMIPAAAVTPTLANVDTNGLPKESNSFHGYTVTMTKIAPI